MIRNWPGTAPRQKAIGSARTFFGVRRNEINVLAVALAGILLYVLLWHPSMLFSSAFEAELLIAAVGTGTAAMLIRRSAAGLVFTVALLWSVDFVLRATGSTANQALTVADVVSAMALLAYLVYGLQLTELGRFAADTPSAKPSAPQFDQGPNATEPGRKLASPVGWIVLSTGCAAAILWLVPLDPRHPSTFGVTPIAGRFLMVFWGLAVAGIVTATVLSVRAWHRLQPNEARAYLYFVVSEQADTQRRSLIRRRLRARAGDHHVMGPAPNKTDPIKESATRGHVDS